VAPKSNRRLLVIVGSVVVFVLLVTGAVFAGASTGTRAVTTTGGEAPAGTVDERVVPGTVAPPTALRTCSIDALADAESLGTLYGYVTNVDTGAGMFSRKGRDAAAPAEAMELLTASVALQLLGSSYRIPTTVYQGAEPGTIVIVGGGDPTLSRTHAGEPSVYPDGPKLDDLATQVNTLLGPGVPITTIVLDASYWDVDDAYDSTWKKAERKDGTMSSVTALQVDGDREDPAELVSPRSTDPVINTGRYFRAARGANAAAAKLEVGVVPENATQLAMVESATVGELVETMLTTGDKTLAESLARVASKASVGDGSAKSLQDVFTGVLGGLGLDMTDVVIRDGSGTSAETKVPAIVVTKLLALARAGGNDLNYVYNSLPSAAEEGLLSERFSGDNSVVRGAFLGTIGATTTVRSIAGILTAEDGTQLAIALYATDDTISDRATAALDAMITGAYICGANLATR
jgi:D-alanyl-D-alanine carboxypeptidase/D-alanyl-D-alanine-endopeptidase (penicillin-binding protein 4)